MQKRGKTLQIQCRKQKADKRFNLHGLLIGGFAGFSAEKSAVNRGGARRECGVRMATARALFN
jgi:hypothetical protein